jgi:hypothetical protein
MPTSSIARRVRPHSAASSTPSRSKQLDRLRYANDRALAALVFSFAIETSQLYHAPWIDAVRATRLGSLVLGSGFVWSDFACYAAGICFGAATEVVAARTTHDSSQR